MTQKYDFNYKKNKKLYDLIIDLFELCSESSLSNIVTSVQVLFQKFENPKSSKFVKFIQDKTFMKQGKDNFILLENVLWDESFPRIFFGSGTFEVSIADIKKKIEQKQLNFFRKLELKSKCV